MVERVRPEAAKQALNELYPVPQNQHRPALTGTNVLYYDMSLNLPSLLLPFQEFCLALSAYLCRRHKYQGIEICVVPRTETPPRRKDCIKRNVVIGTMGALTAIAKRKSIRMYRRCTYKRQ